MLWSSCFCHKDSKMALSLCGISCLCAFVATSRHKFGINAIVQLFADEREALLEEIRRAFVPRVEIAAAGLPVGGDVGGGDFVVNDRIRRPNGNVYK